MEKPISAKPIPGRGHVEENKTSVSLLHKKQFLIIMCWPLFGVLFYLMDNIIGVIFGVNLN
jgi:hypothetical protein